MGVSSYLLRADLRARWRSLALLGVLVAVVVGAVLTALSGARRTQVAFEHYLDEVRPFDAVVAPEDGAVDLTGIEAIDGVEAAVGYHWYGVFPGDLRTQFIPMVVPDDDRVPGTYQRTPVVSGRRPDPTEPLEVALSERTARNLGVEVGDELPVATFTDEQLASGFPDVDAGGELRLDVVGITRVPGDLASRDADIDLTYLTPAFAETYADEVGLFSVGALVIAEPGTSLNDLGARITAEYPVGFDTFFGADTLRRQAAPTLDGMAVGLRIVALVLALVGGTAIVVSLLRDATERIGEHSALRALGVDRGGLLGHLSLAVGLAVAAGAVMGGGLSVVLTPRVLWGLARRAEGNPSVHLDAPVLMGGTLTAMAGLLVVVLLVAWATERREHRQRLDGGRPSSVAAQAAALGAPLSVVAGLRLAFERGRGRRATPVTAAAVAAGLGGLGVVAALVFSSSLQHAVTTPGVYGWAFAGVLSRNVDGPDARPAQLAAADEAQAQIVTDPALATVAEYVLDFDVALPGGPERAVALDDLKGHTAIVVARGHEPLNGSEIAVGATTLEEHGLAIGDTVALRRDDHELTAEIVGVAVLPVNDDGGLASDGIALHRDGLDALGFDGTCADAEPCSRGLAVTSADGVDLDAAVAPYLPSGLSFVEPSAPSEVLRLTAVDRLPRIVAAFLGVVSVITLAHAASVTVRRRRRDLAMLRVLGFVQRDLRNSVRVQVAALSLLGATLGVVLGLAVGRQLWSGVASRVSLPAVITVPVATIFLVPLVIALLAQIGAALSRRAAGRVSTAVALRAE
jgi:hypothetical protein